MVEQQPTLREVAELAGVSIGTASGVFSNKPSVSEAARAAVRSAAADLGYQPPRRRRAANKAGATDIMTIGLVSRVVQRAGSSYPFYGPVLDGAEQACAALGASLVFEVLREDGQEFGGLPLSVQRGQSQGLLLLGYLDQPYVEEIIGSKVPCVLVNNALTAPLADSVCDDDVRGGYLAAKHLIDLGHVDPVPATIAGPQHLSPMRQRLEGYSAALRETVGEPAGTYIRIAQGTGVADGREQMAALLELDTPPTAVVCCNDFTALGALEVLRQRGVNVPAECSVLGYEDLDFAAHAVPPLTTVAVDRELLGKQSVWHLAERIRDPRIAIRDTRLAVSMVERGSTAPPPDRRGAR